MGETTLTPTSITTTASEFGRDPLAKKVWGYLKGRNRATRVTNLRGVGETLKIPALQLRPYFEALERSGAGEFVDKYSFRWNYDLRDIGAMALGQKVGRPRPPASASSINKYVELARLAGNATAPIVANKPTGKMLTITKGDIKLEVPDTTPAETVQELLAVLNSIKPSS